MTITWNANDWKFSFQDAVQYLLHNGIQRHFGKKYQQDFDYNFLTATKQLTPIGWCAQQSRYSNDWDKLNDGDDDWYEGCQACFFKSEWTSWNNFGWVYFLFCSVTRMLEMQWQECDQGGLKEAKNDELVIVFFFSGQSQYVLLFLIHQIQKPCSPGIPKGSRSLCRLEFVQMHHNLYGTSVRTQWLMFTVQLWNSEKICNSADLKYFLKLPDLLDRNRFCTGKFHLRPLLPTQSILRPPEAPGARHPWGARPYYLWILVLLPGGHVAGSEVGS